jgi:transcriptional regulator of acetoin/glycerol metabolism/DNA-binding CsgD family transcriptional regulator
MHADRRGDAGAVAELAEEMTPRDEINASWERSAQAGLTPGTFEVPFVPEVDADGPLAYAAEPVLAELGRDLASEGIGVILTNDQGHVLERSSPDAKVRSLLDHIMLAPGSIYAENAVGTNAIGTALEQDRASVVVGREHFANELTIMTCAAHPIRDLRNGRSLGVIDLSCAVDDGNSLMSTLARRAATEIEYRLLGEQSSTDQMMFQRFAREKRRHSGPLVLVNERLMLTNEAAKQIVHPDDEEVFWPAVVSMLSDGEYAEEIVLKNGAFTVKRCVPVLDSGELIGASVRVAPSAHDATTQTSDAVPPRPTFGWKSLTETERAVTDLVSQGLTNREAAERLFMSHYTIDSHLRSIYRKLGVHSRVELTGIALEQKYRSRETAA